MSEGLAQTVDASAFGQTVQDFGKGRTLALGATIAAPLPIVETSIPITVTADRAMRTTNASVLPRVDSTAGATRLVPNDGRRYESLKTLGRGGMGEVALVEDRDIGRQVALKRLLGEAQGPAAIARFVDEVRTIGRLEHPNIIPIHDVGVDENGQLFFVMKFVEGQTLESILDKLKEGDAATRKKFDTTRMVEIFLGILRALSFAHERGIIHRDIKPANVMVGHYGEVVLMDWGVARPVGGQREGNAPDPSALVVSDGRASMTSAGALIGTPLYMSPEQSKGQNDALDARSDLFSASVMFHEMLNLGHHRLEHIHSLPALLHAIQTDEPLPATRIFRDDAGTGAEYAHFLRKALQLDPAKRWQSAKEMMEELHNIQEGLCRVQCAVTLNKRISREVGRFFDRSPRTALVVASITALLFLALVANAVRDLVT
jgi:serine/threonine-protein kinase